MVSNRGMKDDSRFGVDSRWSWITAFFCAWVLFLTMATVRMSGIFFYGIVEAFGVTRAEASWPVSLAGTLMVLGGPIAGYLCHRFSCRAVLLTCSPLAGIGASICFLARRLEFITISFGIIHGTALCGLYVASNVLLAEHFEKRRATASSFVFAAFGFNSIFLTPLIDFFRTTYGIRGAFLLYGGILLNIIPGVIVLRSPSWLTKPKIAGRKTQAEDYEVVHASFLIEPVNGERTEVQESESQFSCPIQHLDCEKPEMLRARNQKMPPHSCLVLNKRSLKLNYAKECILKVTLLTAARPFFTLTFCTQALSFAAIIFSANIFTMITADLAADRGMTPSDAVYLLQAFSAADIAFRAVAGVMVDSHTLSHELVMLIGYVAHGLAYEWLVWVNAFPQLVVASIFTGATYGSRTCLQGSILVKDFGIAALPVVMGGVFFATGVVLLLTPLVIGYFRDTYGDYTGLLHCLAVVNIFFVCIWTVKLIAKRRAKTTVTSKTGQDVFSVKSTKQKNGNVVG
ncbi:monocarboxylate transporter 12 isoform X1 [Rhipicephalus microplus]|uniref:monocarboxylate transporter 12 isoform X1 n=1 Tax=Rhipicephalus microplus TaxID=6941 RepID=UPI003F6D258F